MKKELPIYCKDCPYYSGVQCQGHGDYWGTCSYLKILQTIFSKLYEDEHTFVDEKVNTYYRKDDSKCVFLQLIQFIPDDNS